MLGSPAGPGGPTQRGLWPLAPAPAPAVPTFTADGFSKCGLYSLFPGGPTFGSALYSHARTIGQITSGHIQQSSTPFYKDSFFSSTGYTFGAPTPPPGSPYSPVQLELLTKGYNSNIIIQQQQEFYHPASLASPSSKKCADAAKCDDKCCKPPPPCQNLKDGGCSRTNPIEWGGVHVKKEPGATPCQVAEISTSGGSPAIVKLEVTSPKTACEALVNSTNNVVARQRFQQEVIGSPAGLLTTVKEVGRITEIEAGMAAGAGTGGATLLQCTDDRGAPLAGWPMGGAQNPAIGTPTLWQYPAPVPLEPLVPLPPVGFQLVRDPTTGSLLLLPTTGIEPLHQTVVWPSYHQPPPVLLPHLPPPPLQLLNTADYLQTSTTHTQTHSTRLVAVASGDTKRKNLPLPLPTTLIKIETADASEKSLIANPIYEPPLLTHVIYPNLILQSSTTNERPPTCLTPPPEVLPIEEPSTSDASNQTDSALCSEDDASVDLVQKELKVEEVVEEVRVVVPEQVAEVSTQMVEVKKPDLSGLELLSNSIAKFEAEQRKPIDVLDGIAQMSIKDPVAVVPSESDLGGLDLLCALAEQRIEEEAKEHKKEKRKLLKQVSEEVPSMKKVKLSPSRQYKSLEGEEEVKKFIVGKEAQKEEKMNDMELDMRLKLADLQRQYREKQKELSKLKPSKVVKVKVKKSASPPPPSEVKQQSPVLLKPPVFEPKLVQPKLEAIKQSDRIINDYKADCLRQQALEDTGSSPEKNSSSKKRKVGRPKKILSPSGFHVTTETIVAKKTKNNYVGYLLAAKEKLLQAKTNTKSYIEDSYLNYKTKTCRNNNTIGLDEVKSKIRPKLKAEATIKSYEEEEEEEEEDEWESEVEEEEVEVVEEVKTLSKCTLTSQHLESDKLRVLTAMGGLFYAGHLNAVEPPDVYSITLDGERGNRPHIMSREEILRDAIVEVAPKSTSELVAGTRLCAYWSQQYRCLYPGSVAEPGTPDPILDSKFVAVEFDDGDSGRIAIDDIRLLPSDYPIIEYDPNPLLSLSKRKRRASASISTEERRKDEKRPNLLPQPDLDLEKENKDIINKPDDVSQHQQQHRERKRLKKKKRDKLKHQKLMNHDDRKRRKKHKCVDENCKHRKHHKKHHRKHKKHHHNNQAMVESTAESDNKVEQEQEVEEVAVLNPEDEVTMDDIVESNKAKKMRERQESCESRSKMSAFLPARQLWGWSGKGYKRPRARGKSRKIFYRSIQRGKETITVGDSAVFLSTGRPDRPYIGKIEAMWELCGKMVVKVKWFYHPEETVGCPSNLQYPGALFESPHVDENDVQTISHKCEVLPLKDYTDRLGDDPQRYETIYDNNDIYYLAGYYDPITTTLKMEPEIPFTKA